MTEPGAGQPVYIQEGVQCQMCSDEKWKENGLFQSGKGNG